MKRSLRLSNVVMCMLCVFAVNLVTQAQESVQKVSILSLQGFDLEQGIAYTGTQEVVESATEAPDTLELELVESESESANQPIYLFDATVDFQIEYDVEQDMVIITPYHVMGMAIFEDIPLATENPIMMDDVQLTLEPIHIPLEFAYQIVVWTADNKYFQMKNFLVYDKNITFEYAAIVPPVMNAITEDPEVVPEPEVSPIPEITPVPTVPVITPVPTTDPSVVPEPATGVLFGVGLVGMLIGIRKLNKNKKGVSCLLVILAMGISMKTGAETFTVISQAESASYDANKTLATKDGIPLYDRNFCWAATASNILYWAGYSNSGMSSSKDLFTVFKDYWRPPLSNCSNSGDYRCYGGSGSFSTAVSWWLKTNPTKACTGSSCAVRVISKGNGGYYRKPVSYATTGGACSTGCMTQVKNSLKGGYGIALGITGKKGNKVMNHVVAGWGYKTDAAGNFTHIYITDSDDKYSGMREFSVARRGNYYYLSGYSIYGYTNFYIRSVVGLKRIPTSKYTLNVSKVGTGSGTIVGPGINCGSDCQEIYQTGTRVALQAMPDSSSTFAGWLVNGQAVSGNVRVTANVTITAMFTRNIPIKNGQIWQGTYTCSQGATALTLRILDVLPASANTLSVKAIFDFNYQNKTIGSYYLNGEYTVSAQGLSFAPGSWIQHPTGYNAVGMAGTISFDGTQYQGQISSANCGAFTLALN